MKPWLKKLGFAGFTLFLFALLVEIGLRLFGYGSYVIYQTDDELLFVPKANQSGRTVAGRERITINADNLRYDENLERVAPDELRIYSFGDSITMGWGVDDQSHYSAVLEQHLERAELPSPVRVISAGVNAYPTSLCVRRFKKLVNEGYQIDVAVLGYSFNIGHETLARLTPDAKKKFQRNVRLKNLVRRSAIYNLVIEDLLRRSVYYRIRDRLVAGAWEVQDEKQPSGASPPSEAGARAQTVSGGADEPAAQAKPKRKRRQPRWSSHVPRYVAALEEMRLLAEERDIDLVFVVLGSLEQRGELGLYQQTMHDFANAHGIPVINMVEIWDGRDHQQLFLDRNHPTAEGHRSIGEELFEAVLPLVRHPGQTPPLPLPSSSGS